jgi:hypothetical protein
MAATSSGPVGLGEVRRILATTWGSPWFKGEVELMAFSDPVGVAVKVAFEHIGRITREEYKP